ncbi:MAG TPA: RNA polymerase subunit sigma-70 [Treponema sp.]|nr:RNA polymerase subunit sigma-70 [Treponema sp.]
MSAKVMEDSDDLMETYCKQIKVFPLLNFEEELELSKRIQNGDKAALHKLVNSNLRLVVKLARNYVTAGTPVMDIIQEGNMGLMHAAEKYSHLRNARFCTYASWWIRQFITRYLSNKRRMVRLPHRKEETLRKIRYAYHSLCQTLMRQPRNEDIAGKLGIPVKDVDNIISMSCGPLCLEADSTNNENGSIMEIHADYTYNPERNMLRKTSLAGTLRFLNTLQERERRILTYRYQLNGCEHHTLKKISDKMGISPETVRQIEIRALNKIRDNAEELKSYVFLEAM